MTRTLQKRPYGLCVCVCMCECVCVSVCRSKRLVPLTMLNYSCVTSNQVCNISRKRQRSPKTPPSECICSSARSESRTLWLYLENWNILFLKSLRRKKKKVNFFFFFVSNAGRYGYNFTGRRASDACDVLKMCSGMESSLRGWFGHECVGAGRMRAWQLEILKDKKQDSCRFGRLLGTWSSTSYAEIKVMWIHGGL